MKNAGGRGRGGRGRRSAEAIRNASFAQVVGRHFDADAVTDGEADEVFAHLAGEMRENFMAVVQLDPEHGAGQHGGNRTFKFDWLFVTHLSTHGALAEAKLRKDTDRKFGHALEPGTLNAHRVASTENPGRTRASRDR